MQKIILKKMAKNNGYQMDKRVYQEVGLPIYAATVLDVLESAVGPDPKDFAFFKFFCNLQKSVWM